MLSDVFNTSAYTIIENKNIRTDKDNREKEEVRKKC